MQGGTWRTLKFGSTPKRWQLTYLLPIRSESPPDDELTQYLRWLSTLCDVVVVDGSLPGVFEAAHHAWGGFAAHVPPASYFRCANGKVRGVLTGLAYVSTPCVVIADDDIRYTASNLAAVVGALAGADLVVPQNYFDPLPWHARWDTARSLINRVFGGDFPGTLGVRTASIWPMGYDGDVLFENLELMRTLIARGGSVRHRPDVFVRRLPPTTRHFAGQRVRQAYDELARPIRLAVWMSVLPMLVVRRGGAGRSLAVAAMSVLLAEAGRRKAGGRQCFPPSCSLLAPAWVAERSICIWIALFMRLRGGVRYGQGRIVRAANPTAQLRNVHRLQP